VDPVVDPVGGDGHPDPGRLHKFPVRGKLCQFLFHGLIGLRDFSLVMKACTNWVFCYLLESHYYLNY